MRERPIIALVAGETSGDQLAAPLIEKLRLHYPQARFVGIGGEQMQGAGMECWWNSGELAVFGLFEVLGHFPKLLNIRRELRRRLLALRPDVFIGIDAPDFNLGLEIKFKAQGIRTVHYVSPTVWAWRPGRVKKIARAADLVLCLFPFEPAFYAHHNVAAVYVGHPLADQIEGCQDMAAARHELGLAEDAPVLALLPGSRISEVTRLSAPMLQAAKLMQQGRPEMQVVAAIANERVLRAFSENLALTGLENLHTVLGRPRTVIAASDVVLCASGTATLETLLINRPMVMAYKLAPATYHVAKNLKLIKRQFFALPNILAGESLIPELIQDEASGGNLARAATVWLDDAPATVRLRLRFSAIHEQLRCNASSRAAAAVIELMQSP